MTVGSNARFAAIGSKPATASEPLSPLAAAIAAMGRRVYVYDVTGFFGPGAKEMPRLGFRVAVKAEDDNAIVLAHAYAQERSRAAGDAAESARQDADLLGDAKVIHALCEVCRDVRRIGPDVSPSVNEPEWGVTQYSAFPGPDWMRKHLGTDHLAAMMRLYMKVRRRESPAPDEATDERVEALAAMCRNHASDTVPDVMLAAYPHEWLTDAFVILSEMLGEARQSVDVLMRQADERAAERATEPGPLAGDGEP